MSVMILRELAVMVGLTGSFPTDPIRCSAKVSPF